MKVLWKIKPPGYPGYSWGRPEYPLMDEECAHKCPAARYVGGTSKYLCECPQPRLCEGVLAAVKKYYPEQIVE